MYEGPQQNDDDEEEEWMKRKGILSNNS